MNLRHLLGVAGAPLAIHFAADFIKVELDGSCVSYVGLWMSTGPLSV